jgi:hypothetical protein
MRLSALPRKGAENSGTTENTKARTGVVARRLLVSRAEGF